MIRQYRKRPVVTKAIWYDGTNADELVAWGVDVRRQIGWGRIVIGTLEDGDSAQVEHVASPGDYIIRGVQGEFYPCRSDIFQATYELVADQ